MNELNLNNVFTNQLAEIPVIDFFVNIVLAAVLSAILSVIYTKFGNSLSNRNQFSRNFILLCMTTTLIITVVKSSLALSLGLVGALSIVRFRAPIKEPEELAYLFLTIAIGLGLGADQRFITITAFTIICMVIFLISKGWNKKEFQNMYLTVSWDNSDEVGKKLKLDNVVKVLSSHSKKFNIKRLENNQTSNNITCCINYVDFDSLNKSIEELKQLESSLSVIFIDNVPVY